MTSALIPWNSCGAFMAATLAVSPWAYLPYAILNWITPDQRVSGILRLDHDPKQGSCIGPPLRDQVRRTKLGFKARIQEASSPR